MSLVDLSGLVGVKHTLSSFTFETVLGNEVSLLLLECHTAFGELFVKINESPPPRRHELTLKVRAGGGGSLSASIKASAESSVNIISDGGGI